jgi:hypothetical protein
MKSMRVIWHPRAAVRLHPPMMRTTTTKISARRMGRDLRKTRTRRAMCRCNLQV